MSKMKNDLNNVNKSNNKYRDLLWLKFDQTKLKLYPEVFKAQKSIPHSYKVSFLEIHC